MHYMRSGSVQDTQWLAEIPRNRTMRKCDDAREMMSVQAGSNIPVVGLPPLHRCLPGPLICPLRSGRSREPHSLQASNSLRKISALRSGEVTENKTTESLQQKINATQWLMMILSTFKVSAQPLTESRGPRGTSCSFERRTCSVGFRIQLQPLQLLL